MFWDYIKEIHKNCGTELTKECSRNAHNKIKKPKPSWTETQKCVTDSFSLPRPETWTDNTTTNTLIEEDLRYWELYGSNLFPSVVINNVTFRG